MKQATQQNPILLAEGIVAAMAVQAALTTRAVPCKVVPLNAVKSLPPFPGTLIAVGG